MAQNLITKHIIEAVVKPTLDKGEREKLNADLGRIFADASNIDFNTKETRDSLNNLARAFQAIFDKIGDKSIDFEELIKMPAPDTFAKLGEVAAKQFWNAWESVAKGMSGGVSQDMLKEQFNQLKKQRAELVRQQKALPQKQKRYEELSLIADDLPYMDENEFEAFTKKEIEKMGANIDKIALDMQQAMVDALDKLSDISLDDPKYDEALEDAFEKTQKVFKMSRTLEKHPDLVTDKTILDDYDFKYLQETFGEDLEAHSIRLSGLVRKVVEEMDAIPLKLREIDEQILQIQNSGIEIVDQTSAKNGLKTLNEIEEAYKRILNHKAVDGEFRANQKELDKIQSALDFDPSQSKQGIKSLYEDYQKAAASGNWEAEYQALLKYVKLYEEYRQSENKTHRNKVTRPDNPFTPLYERLKPMAENAQNALQNIVNMTKNQPLVGMGGAGGSGSGDASDEATNAERIAEAKRVAAEKEAEARKEADAKAEVERKAAEEAERQAKAEKEKAAALKQRRIEEERLAKAVEKRVGLEEKEKTLILEKKEIIAEMFRMSNEVGLFFNSKTGEVSDPLEGGKHSVVTTLDEWKQAAATQFDTRLHKHNYNVAAPSFSGQDNDFVTWLKGFEHIKKQMILSNKEILSFDFSSISKETLRSIATLYTQAAKEIDAEFDGYINNRKVGDMFGTFDNMQEQMQVRLREALEGIMREYPGIMTSYQLPSDMINTSKAKPAGAQDDSVNKRGVEVLKVEADAHRDNADAINEETRAVENLNNAKAEEPGSSLVDKYSQASDEIKKKYQEIIALQDQIDELERKTQKTPIDIDPWNATKKQKDQIVAAWREYQKVVQEIAAMPIVETEDDEKRLLELKAKAVSLYETMHQGHLNDVLGDGYAKEYGLSLEDGKQMHLDMQDTPRKDFDKSLGGLKSKLNDAYNAAQKLDQEMYVMMLRADDDSIENLYEKIRQDALAAEQAVDSLNDSIEETKNVTQSSGGGTGTGDASFAELEAAVTKTEALQDEVEQKNKELVDKDAEIARVRAENETKLKTEADEKARLQEDLNATNQQLADVKHENELYDTALTKVTEESNAKDGIIRDLREQLANVKTGASEEQTSVSSEELKNVLNSIVYNVKITHDDNDKTANKIAIDESALESTLKRVFTNVINPHTEQNDLEPKNEPWALEKTLQTVKDVLDGIKTNTTKPESLEVTPAKTEVGNVLATENTLAAIKSAVEAINKKTVRGTKATDTSSKQGPKQETDELVPYVADDDSDSTSTKSNDKSMKLLADISLQRKNLEKFITQLQTSGRLTDEYQVWIDNLTTFLDSITSTDDMAIWKKAFARTKTSVGIDDVVDKEETKLTKKQALTGKAGNAIGRAEGVWLEALSLDENSISPEFIERINQYNEQLDALRRKHLEISSSKGPISEEDQKILIAQTAAINKQTSELSELISEYQKLSGSNVDETKTQATTLTNKSPLDNYETQLKQYAKSITDGKAQIKSFNAETKTLTYTVKTGKNEFTEYTAAVRNLDHQMVSVQGTTKRTETFFEATARKMRELTSYFSGMAIFNRVGQELRRGIQYIREIDLALTELRKVTDQTEEEYDQFLQTAAKTGAKLGTTISAVTEATSTFAKLGYSMEQATEMAESAIVYKNVGDNIASTEDAADSIISTMKGFKLEATEAMRIVDRFNEVGKSIAHVI